MQSASHSYEPIEVADAVEPADQPEVGESGRAMSTADARHSMLRALLPLIVVLTGLLLLAFVVDTQPSLSSENDSATSSGGKRAWTLEPLNDTGESPHNPHLYLAPPPTRLAVHARLMPRDAASSSSDNHRPPRLLVVGDIHGCFDELRALVTAGGIDPARGDAVVAAGDLVAKGPKSREVIQWLRENGHFSVLGNHDQHVLKSAMMQGRLDGRRYRADSDIELWSPASVAQADRGSEEYARTYYARMNGFTDEESSDYAHYSIARELSDDELSWLAALPISIDLSAAFPESGSGSGSDGAVPAWTVVHAGLVPDVPLEAQHPYHVTMMRNWDGETSTPLNDTARGSAWSVAQPVGAGRDQPRGVIFGHDAGRGFQYPRPDRLGLDTGASIGKFLSGLVLPEGRVASVPSAFVYFPPRTDTTRAPPLPSGALLKDVPCVEPAYAHSARPGDKPKRL